VRAGHDLRVERGIQAGGSIVAGNHLEAGWGMLAGSDIVADGTIRAGEGLMAAGDIVSGTGHGIYAGLRVRLDAWADAARVMARTKPATLISGHWCGTPAFGLPL
jgi:hypothetical protein